MTHLYLIAEKSSSIDGNLRYCLKAEKVDQFK